MNILSQKNNITTFWQYIYIYLTYKYRCFFLLLEKEYDCIHRQIDDTTKDPNKQEFIHSWAGLSKKIKTDSDNAILIQGDRLYFFENKI